MLTKRNRLACLQASCLCTLPVVQLRLCFPSLLSLQANCKRFKSVVSLFFQFLLPNKLKQLISFLLCLLLSSNNIWYKMFSSFSSIDKRTQKRKKGMGGQKNKQKDWQWLISKEPASQRNSHNENIQCASSPSPSKKEETNKQQ